MDFNDDLFAGAPYGAADQVILQQAFDHAWEQVLPLVRSRTAALKFARQRLASILLGLASAETKLDALALLEEPFTPPARRASAWTAALSLNSASKATCSGLAARPG